MVLYVGGTLGMVPNEKGSLDVKKGYLTEQMNTMPELKAPGMPKFTIKEYTTLKDSSDMGMKDWILMAKDIRQHYDDVSGFVICHGTDTMHFTAAALSFMLENLAKPVIVTGAMVPFNQAYNDARNNIIIALKFAASPELAEVCLFSNDRLLRGNRAVKARVTMSSFESPNFPPLALVNAEKLELKRDLLRPQPHGTFRAIYDLRSVNVVRMMITTGFDLLELESMIARHMQQKQKDGAKDKVIDCIVFEIVDDVRPGSTFTNTLQYITRLVDDAGIVVVVTAYEIHGTLSRGAMKLIHVACPAVVFIGDMLTETAVVKAIYLFGRGETPYNVRKFMTEDLRGELTDDEYSHSRLLEIETISKL